MHICFGFAVVVIYVSVSLFAGRIQRDRSPSSGQYGVEVGFPSGQYRPVVAVGIPVIFLLHDGYVAQDFLVEVIESVAYVVRTLRACPGNYVTCHVGVVVIVHFG